MRRRYLRSRDREERYMEALDEARDNVRLARRGLPRCPGRVGGARGVRWTGGTGRRGFARRRLLPAAKAAETGERGGF